MGDGGLLGGSSQDGRKWLIPRVGTSPTWGCSFFEWPKWLINGGDPNHLPENWDDPLSKGRWIFGCVFVFVRIDQVLNKLKDRQACGKLPTFKFAMVTKAFWNQTRFPFLNHKLTNISRL